MNHSKWSASAMTRWSTCAGSIQLCEDLPRTESVYSREGTVAHNLSERCFTGDLFRPSDALDAVVDGVKIDQEMVDAVNTYIEYVDSLPRKHGCTGGCETHYEQTLKIDPVKMSLDRSLQLFGTADAIFYKEEVEPHPRKGERKSLTIEIVDFKYGKGVPVEIKGNLQLRYYALGFLHKLMGRKKILQNFLEDKCLEIRLTIVQPRAKHEEGPIRTEYLSQQDILDFESQLRSAIQHTLDHPDDFVVGSHCRFCPGKEICPTYNQPMQEELTEVDYLKISGNPKDMSPDEFAEILECCDLLEAAIKRHRRYAEKLLESGNRIPGWRLSPTRPTRRWSSEDQLRQHLQTLEFDVQQKANLAALSPSQLESILPSEDWDKIAHLVESRSSGTKLSFNGPSAEEGLQLLL